MPLVQASVGGVAPVVTAEAHVRVTVFVAAAESGMVIVWQLL